MSVKTNNDLRGLYMDPAADSEAQFRFLTQLGKLMEQTAIPGSQRQDARDAYEALVKKCRGIHIKEERHIELLEKMGLYPWNNKNKETSNEMIPILCRIVIMGEQHLDGILHTSPAIRNKFLKQLQKLTEKKGQAEDKALEVLLKKCEGVNIEEEQSIKLLEKMDLYPWNNDKTAYQMATILCGEVKNLYSPIEAYKNSILQFLGQAEDHPEHFVAFQALVNKCRKGIAISQEEHIELLDKGSLYPWSNEKALDGRDSIILCKMVSELGEQMEDLDHDKSQLNHDNSWSSKFWEYAAYTQDLALNTINNIFGGDNIDDL